ncbi:brain-specific angiogenesis inhibitor 1-associated protein 2 isoform X1 [Hippocampus comes]|uniref:brain-specific angiogenesis inhibitor 1-associated protein 2 isoform X1 n=1 Tax=Hippocampus comes TaxID=109280 RepID=UPI00094F0734|nr:PREDICTED: brain-specific angiogenesis inhibitor 1-associated protein 2-like isoform X1 [Hippocampus comes]XP_019724519.1 PREDICTED: brain-specific angiogenesis inhibitor 1-associated protein 2-like isoform X1 [Hippocampus comes]
MSRTDEVNKMTENVYKGILDHFNPSLKNFVTMGKHYEKALTGVTVAAKGYFDALVKLGELASDSQGSKELGDTLFQMAEVHRQIQVQLEDVLKLFHSELLAQLEQKLELDIKYLTATLKKYQNERRSKTDSIERCQAQLKKLRRKSLGSRHPNKYGDREMQFVELMSRRQVELDTLVATGYRSALTEERRRYCFLVDRQCCVTKLLINYHCKVKELLSQKLSSWQQSCTQPTKLPERALNLLRHTAPQSSGAAGIAEVLRYTKLGCSQPEQRLSVQEVPPLLNGDRSQQQQQQQQHSLPSSSSQSDACPQGSPQTFRSVSATGTSSRGASPQHSCSPLTVSATSPLADSSTSGSASPAASTPTGGAAQPASSLLLAANTSNLSPSLIPSTVMSLSQVPPSESASQGVTLAIPHSAPHSPTLPHSAPLSRAMTPVQLLHQQVGPGGNNTLPVAHPWLKKTAEMCATSTLPLPKRPGSEMRLGGFQGARMLPLSGPTRVEAMFAHSPGASEGGGGGGGASLLHFLPGDSITLLISEPRDGWHYGQNDRTGRKGWFPFSYTQPQHGRTDHLERRVSLDHTPKSSFFLSKANSTSMSQLDQLVSPNLSPESAEERSFPPQRISTFRPRPYSMADSNRICAQLASSPPSPTRYLLTCVLSIEHLQLIQNVKGKGIWF